MRFQLTSYYRQAKSYQLLGNKVAAIDILSAALQRPSLTSDKGLSDFLVQLQESSPKDE